MNQRSLRILLAVVACLAGIYEIAVARTLWQFMVRPDLLPRRPFEVSITGPEIRSVEEEAAAAGVTKGDRLISVNGIPFSGAADYTRPLLSSKPGDVLQVETSARRTAITLRAMPKEGVVLGYVWLDFLIQLIMPLFCLALGFVVAFLRPADIRSWILLGLMISFRGHLEIVSRQSHWPVGLQELGLFFKQAIPGTWPIWMMLLGLYFPERLPRARWAWVTTVLLSVPVAAWALFDTAVQWAYYRSAATLAQLIPWANSAGKTANLISAMIPIGLFFALAGMQWGTAQSADSKRRAKLLNIGSQVAFLPVFVLLVRSVVNGQSDLFQGTPRGVMILIYAAMSIFPLTLAYIILVHRAMDIRMVVRTGLQYALARRGVRVLQVLLTFAAVWYAGQLWESGLNRPLRLQVLSMAVAAVLLLQRAAEWARGWTDRRFFREAYDAERVLSELSEEVRTMVETRPLLERVGQRISESLHVPRVAMMLRDGARFEPVYATGYEGARVGAFAAAAQVAERLERSREPELVYFDDPNSWVNRQLTDAAERERLVALDTQLLLPLASRGRLLGFASLGPKRSEEPYSGMDLRLLRSVGAQAGMALENSRLAAQVANEAARREMEEREMRIARDVQMRLFPQRRPEVAGLEYAGACRPAQSVGGDYFDFVEVEGGEFGFAVGDVSGKGVPAALLMAGLVAALRGQAMAAPRDLAVLMANVNRLIFDASPKSHFATLFYAQYRPETRRLRYTNAGHNPPLVIRAGGTVEELRPLGPGVGLTGRSRYGEQELELAAGDVVIAYTDGFTEAMNGAREEFGEGRLREAALAARSLRAEDMIPALMEAVDRFAGGAAQSDDMTMVVVKVVG